MLSITRSPASDEDRCVARVRASPVHRHGCGRKRQGVKPRPTMLLGGILLGLSSQRNVAGYEDLALHVKEKSLVPVQQFPDHLGIAHRRMDDVLLDPVVEDQLERKASGPPALLLGPGRLVIRNLTDRDRVLRTLFRLCHAFLLSPLYESSLPYFPTSIRS